MCEGGGQKDFADAHCDVKVGIGEGDYGHVAIKNDETREIEVTNETTRQMRGQRTHRTALFV
jgi:hypothetical protein